MRTKLRGKKKLANTRYRLQETMPERPNVKIPVPTRFLTDAWIEILDIDTYKEIFPAYTHKICQYFGDWRVFVHKTDPIFLTGDIYVEVKEEIIKHFGDKVSKLAHKNKVHEDDMNLWELIEFVGEHLGTDVVIDLDTLEITYTGLDKEVGIDYNSLSQNKLRGLCRERGLVQRGNKSTLIKRLQENE